MAGETNPLRANVTAIDPNRAAKSQRPQLSTCDHVGGCFPVSQLSKSEKMGMQLIGPPRLRAPLK